MRLDIDMLQKQQNYYLTHPDQNSDMEIGCRVSVRLLSEKCTCFLVNQILLYTPPTHCSTSDTLLFYVTVERRCLIGGRAGVTGDH